ncbi:hypothetical protein TR2A62_3011 [Thalassobium sp. R2A62]|nr:hypothetical protein TR2A62_3011 [Thalassobium sp. R2A62]
MVIKLWRKLGDETCLIRFLSLIRMAFVVQNKRKNQAKRRIEQ